ncbi:MAG: hypothetical protein K8I00_02130, partial [Candidatus Omnitrophica bacterium]|nr:hypothetical protein [Candidatus Omnitrophota bacterium]
KITNEFQNSSGVDGDWNIAPPGSLHVEDLEIKGVQLGMPEILVKDTLEKAGFEQDQLYQFSKEIRLIDGVEKEITRSDRKGISAESLGPLVKKYVITIQTVEPSMDLLSELDEPPLRGMIAQARKTLGSLPLYLVYHIEYTQSFGSDTKHDISALKNQIGKFFGNPTYQPTSIHRRLGSAYGTDENNWLIYHDATHVPVVHREHILSQVKGKSDEAAMLKKAFQHPCGARERVSCVNAGLIGAFPDSLELRLEAARIIYSPVMMVHFQGSKITTLLEWAYIKSEKSIREYFAKTKAQADKPTATLDF